jgi:predicted RNA-binding Zn ribbon-like protein
MVANPWHLPVLDDLSQLAALVGLTQAELDWFSDPKHWARITTSAALQHYRVSTRPAPSGAVRVLEAPKHRLRTLQRLLLDRVLDGVPAHDAAHGFRRGRSVATFAAPHAGRASCCGWTSRGSSRA